MNKSENENNIKISEDIFRKICNKLKHEIIYNKGVYNKIEELDFEYSRIHIKTDKLIKIIDNFDKSISNEQTKYEKYTIIHSGNPYVTLGLCLEGLKNSKRLNLIIEDLFFGTNKLIVEILKETLKDYKIYGIIELGVYTNKNDLEKRIADSEHVICLGDKNILNNCISKKDVQFIPYNDVDIYCESDELYGLAKDLYDVCIENGIEAEIYEEMDIKEAVDTINKCGNGFCSVIITQNEDLKREFKNSVKSKYVFANENPVDKLVFSLPNIFSMEGSVE